MKALYKLWVTLSLAAFVGMALAPAIAAASLGGSTDVGGGVTNYGATSYGSAGPTDGSANSNPSSQTYAGGNNSSSYSGNNNSSTFPGGNNPPTYTGNNNPPTYSGGNTVGGIQNPLGQVTGICQLLKIVLNIALLLGVPIAMFFIVFAGFKLVLARGRPEELKKARLNLVWTLAGIAIFIGVWTFVTILANTLGALGVSILGDCR